MPASSSDGPRDSSSSSTSRARAPRRRASDKWWRGGVWRDVWLFVVTVVVAIALSTALGAVDQQREGRRVALTANCAIAQGVVNAGYSTLTSGATIGPSRLERALEDLGLPSRAVRQQAAQIAGAAYAAAIGSAVEHAAGIKQFVRIVQHPATATTPASTEIKLDCGALQRAAFVEKTR